MPVTLFNMQMLQFKIINDMRYTIKRNDNKYLYKLNSFIQQEDNEWTDDISEALELTIGKCNLFIRRHNILNYNDVDNNTMFTTIELV